MIKLFAVSLSKTIVAVSVLLLAAPIVNAGIYSSLINCEQVKASNNKADKWRELVPPRWLPSSIGEAIAYINESPWCTMVSQGQNHYVVLGSTTDGGTMNLGLQIHGDFKPPHYFPSMRDYRVAMRLCYAPADLTLMPEGFAVRAWVSGKNAGHECLIFAMPHVGKLHSQGREGR